MLDFIGSALQAWHLLKRQVQTQGNILTFVQLWMGWESNPFSVLLWDCDGNVVVDQMLAFMHSLFFPFLLPLLHSPIVFRFLFFFFCCLPLILFIYHLDSASSSFSLRHPIHLMQGLHHSPYLFFYAILTIFLLLRTVAHLSLTSRARQHGTTG